MSRAIGTIQAQQSAVAINNAPLTSHRSRRSSISSEVPVGMDSAHHTVRTPVDAREVGVGPIKLEFNRTRGRVALPADEFRLGEFEAGRERDTDLVIVAGDWVFDRRGAA